MSAQAPAAFRVTVLVDPGRGGRRRAFVAALGKRAGEAPLTLPSGTGSVDFVCTGPARMRPVRGARGGGLPAEIVPEVLAPGDLLVVRPRGEGVPARLEALRLLPPKAGRKKATG